MLPSHLRVLTAALSSVLLGCGNEPPRGSHPVAPSGTTTPVSAPPPATPPAPPPPPAGSDEVPASVQVENERHANPVEPPPTFTCGSHGPPAVDLFKGRLAVNATFDQIDQRRVCQGSRDCPNDAPRCLLCPGGKLIVPSNPGDMKVVIGPADRGVCIGTTNSETGWNDLLAGQSPMDPACVADVAGKEALTIDPGASAWLDPWRAFLHDEQKLPDAYVRDHIRVRTWDLAGDGMNRMFTVHYTYAFDWVNVSMNDAFETHMSGATSDRQPSDFTAELHAHRLTGTNEPHGWYLRVIKGHLISRAAAEKHARTCPNVSGGFDSDNSVTLGEDGHFYANAYGVMDKQGHCPAAAVELETGKTSCGQRLCAVF